MGKSQEIINEAVQQLLHLFNGERREKNRTDFLLRQQSLFFQNLIDAIPIPIYYKDTNGIYLRCNQAFVDLLGLAKDQIIGKKISEIAPPEIAEQCEAMDQELFAHPGKQSFEWKLSQPDGSVREILVNKAPLYTPEGNLAGLVGVILDITERKRMEEELKQSEMKYRSLIENASDGIFTISPDGILVDANPAGLDLLGYPKDELLGRNVLEFIVENREQIQTQIESGKVGGKALVRTRLLRKDGTKIPVEVSAQKRPDKFFQAFVRNLSEKQKMEEELAKLARLDSLAVLAGGIAHDFNNFLMTILGNLSLVKLSLDPNSELFEDILDAERACQKARNLTQQLSTFAKGGAPIKEVKEIGNLVQETVNFALRGSKSRAEFEIDQDLWLAEVDESRFTQVINNLVINADQAMPDGGTIKVRAENVFLEKPEELGLQLSPGKYLKISFEDQGVGIAPENLPKIFDPFFSTKPNGRGLGLATSYSIIKNHGGQIRVSSELGKGSTFEIYLPATEKPINAQEIKEKPQTLITGKGRVLLMDDEESVRKVAKKLIESLGYQVMPAKDGKEALDFYQAAKDAGVPFDLVIMDLIVPGGMGGEETIKILRQIDPEVKAIVASGYSNKPVMAEYQKYGFNAVLTKPFEIHQLSKVLHQLSQQTRN